MLTYRLSGDLTLRQQLAVLGLPPAARKKHHRYVAKRVIRQAKRNVQRQTDVHGRPLAKRRHGKGKVLRKLPRTLKAFVGPNKATVTWPGKRAGQIARAQQEGVSNSMTAGQARRIGQKKGEATNDSPATKAQAKALIEEGFRRPVGKYASGQKKGQSRTSRVSQRWITENMTISQASSILKIMRNQQAKQQWQIPLPEREFFGLAPADVVDVRNHLINQILTDVQRAA